MDECHDPDAVSIPEREGRLRQTGGQEGERRSLSAKARRQACRNSGVKRLTEG
jgi:hypothetical protein